MNVAAAERAGVERVDVSRANVDAADSEGVGGVAEGADDTVDSL